MKQRIFNKGRGWYISCTNKNNQDDKCYINVYFKDGDEPYADLNDKDFVFIDIDIKESRFYSSNKKPYLKVFVYDKIVYEGVLDEVAEENGQFAESVIGTEYERKFGGSQAPVIDEKDLPFY